MKKIQRYNEFITESNEEWVERELGIPLDEFFARWFKNKKKIDEDDNYITYEHHDKDYDEKEGEYFWEKKMILKVDKQRTDITHYWEMELISRPLYKIRVEGMTHEQELKVRSWCGTDKNPKSGKFIGHDKGLTKFKSFLSNKVNGRLYHVLPEGDFIEMLDDEKIKDKDFVNSIFDYLMDTDNIDLIPIVQKQINNL